MICEFKINTSFLLFITTFTYLTMFHTKTAMMILMILLFLSILLFFYYKREIVNALNEIYYNKDTNIDIFLTEYKGTKEILDCSICLDDFLDEDAVFKINCPCTEQYYHKDCIKNWLEKNCSCPICRKILREKDDD